MVIYIYDIRDVQFLNMMCIITLPLPISHYAKTTFLFQIRIYAKSTCVHTLFAMEIFRYMRG